MELIWVFWFILGIIAGTVANVLAERESDKHRNSDIDASVTPGERDGMDKPIPSPAEIEAVLYILRIGASRREKDVIDYLIDKEGIK